MIGGRAGVVLAIAAVLLGSCRRPALEAPRVVYAPTPCLSAADAPPAPPGRGAIAGPEEGCPAPQGCVSAALYVWVATSLKWMRDTWTKCGPPATPATTDGGE